ncbi:MULTISPECIES: xanthine dehydrogenase family protein molybdopterin-binding subunit [Thermocrispum]|jgi:2-furoyl-CoA dehydrogenase large subunit|uniref:Aldehyde oxidase n=1 Tax=Thermocrispum agreste TaxID=37925 RepID=A0A2W4JNR9_9PSEU|nr:MULTISPECIES: xanthine dehydrogenase family protein molybdopterin-binding subunit [Thermocrispum]PZM99908.1 MAG: aldehyde oxidase [Thermocrispum agreste]
MTIEQTRPDTRRFTGKAMPRKEDARLLKAQGEFGDDTPVANLAYMAFVRSPYAHARIVDIDVSAAEKVDGYLGCLLPDEVAELTDPYAELQGPPGDAEVDRCLAAGGKVRFSGEPVVAVAATSREAARDAAAAVVVDYEPLPHVVDTRKAVEPDAPLVHDQVGCNVAFESTFDWGDIDFALENADHVIEVDELHFHRFSSTPLECTAITAEYDAGTDTFTFTGGFATPQLATLNLAGALRHPTNKLRVLSKDIGGSFGIKLNTHIPATAAALLARKLGRPIRWTETRTESHQMGGHGNERWFRNVKMALQSDGTVLGLSYEALDDVGAYTRYEPLGAVIWTQVANACYQLKHLRVHYRSVYTNKCPTHPNRGYSRTQHLWLVERMMDIAAHKLGFDPVEFRMKNYIQPDQYPYTTVNGCVYDSGNLPESLRKALELIDYEEARQLQRAAAGTGKRIGIGIGSTLDSGTNNFGQARLLNPHLPFGGNSEAALVRLGIDGAVYATTGAVAFGQGHETTISQVVADELGVSYDDVHVQRGSDSGLSAQMGLSGSYASQFAVTGIGAMLNATRKLAAEIKQVAAAVLGVKPEEIELADGKARVVGDAEKALPLSDVAGIVHFSPASLPREVAENVGLVGRAVYSAPFDLPDLERKYGNLTLTYATQIHACVVEIDEETGQTTLLRYAMVDDCGTPINPMVIEGQVHGATAHGISAALFEDMAYDENGQLRAGNFYDYHAATAFDLPSFRYANVVSPSPFTPIGAKGMGEGGGAPLQAISAAIQDAVGDSAAVLDSFNPPERVLRLLRGLNAEKVKVIR